MPRKGKDFTPAQKSAITQQFNKHHDSIKKVEAGKWSFIPKKKGVGLDDIPRIDKTNKGIFYNAPGARVTKKKRGEKPILRISYRKLREFYIPFPLDILGNMDLIQIFVEGMEQKFKPDYIMWAINGNQGRVRYDLESFQEYGEELMMGATIWGKQFSKDMRKAKREGANFLTGVFFGWLPPGH